MIFQYGTEPGQFDIILLDPPWDYANRLTGANRTSFGEGASGHYQTMKNPDIVRLGPLIEAISAPRAVMFMWVTNPTIEYAYLLGKAANYKYSTKAFDWTKLTDDGSRPKGGPGTYTSSNSEDCLLFTYTKYNGLGKLKPSDVGGKRMVPQTIEEWHPWTWEEEYGEDVILNIQNGSTLAWPEGVLRVRQPRMKHSQKPNDVHKRIDLMYPGARKIELFARRPYPDWAVLGNDIDSLDIREALELAAAGYYDLERKEEMYG